MKFEEVLNLAFVLIAIICLGVIIVTSMMYKDKCEPGKYYIPENATVFIEFDDGRWVPLTPNGNMSYKVGYNLEVCP